MTGRPLRIVLAGLCAGLALSGCSDTPTSQPEGDDPGSGAAKTHSGGQAVEVYNSYVNAFRHKQGDVACAFASQSHQRALGDAANQAKRKPLHQGGRDNTAQTVECERAIIILAPHDAPEPPSSINIVEATDQTTVLNVTPPGREPAPVRVELIKTEHSWVIDSIETLITTSNDR